MPTTTPSRGRAASHPIRRGGRRPLRAAAITLLTAGTAATASAAPALAKPATKLDLTPTAVRSATVASPGGRLPVRVTVAASARAKQPSTIAVYLSKDATRSKDDVRLTFPTTAPKTAARATNTIAASVTLPATQAVETLRVVACVDDPSKVRERTERNNCRTAKSPVQIVAAPAPSTDPVTPQGLIGADVNAGKLTHEQGLVYRALAAFGDPRLPAKYAAVAAAAEADDGIMREIASAWPTLSKAARKAVGPFFQAPPLRDAIAAGTAKPNRQLGKAKKSSSRATRSADDEAAADPEGETAPEVCARTIANAGGWKSIPAAAGKVRISWKDDRPEDAKLAPQLAADVTKAYDVFKRVLGREPLRDDKVDCFHGEDGAVDIYLDHVFGKAGVTIPATMTDQYMPDCESYPGFIVANAGGTSSFTGRFTLAHELFHAFQMSYRYSGGCPDATWLDEGSATWAAHEVFPDDQSEHIFDLNMQFIDSPIEAGDYWSWPLFLWMEKTLGEGSIRRTYEALPKNDALHATDVGIGTWRSKFLDFAKHGWNQTPFASFVEWDQFNFIPKVGPEYPSHPVIPVHLFLNGAKKRTAYAEFAVSARGRDYKRYLVTDEKLREITFKNTLAGEPDARIGAILTLRDGSTRWEDWSGKERVRLCRDRPGQDVTEIVLVYANTKLNKRFHGGSIVDKPEMLLRDSCDDLPWHFEVLWGTLKTNIDAFRPGSAKQGLCTIDGFETRDQLAFLAPADGEGYQADKNVITLASDGKQLEGDLQVHSQTAAWDHILKGCQGWDSNEAKTECHATKHQDAGSGFDVGLSLSAESREAQVATLKWWLPPAIAGFVDSDDSVCNVFTMDRSVDVDGTEDELIESDVLMSDLESGKPITLTQKGTRTWNADQYDEPAVIAYSWEFTMRIQRVEEDGSPL